MKQVIVKLEVKLSTLKFVKQLSVSHQAVVSQLSGSCQEDLKLSFRHSLRILLDRKPFESCLMPPQVHQK